MEKRLAPQKITVSPLDSVLTNHWKLRLFPLFAVWATACGQAMSDPPALWQASPGADEVLTGGTGPSEPTSSSTCVDGESRCCQLPVKSTADTVSCFRGTQVCNAGVWGPCEMGTVSLERRVNVIPGAVSPGSKSLLSYSSSAACTGAYANVCDPGCQLFQEGPSGLQIPATTGSQNGTKIDGPFCYFSLYSPGAASVKGGKVTGNVGSAGSLVVGESGAVQLTGEVATCGNLTINNGSTITGTAEVKGKVIITNSNGNKAIVGAGSKYTSQSTVEANRVALWVAGNNTGSTWYDVWDYSFQNGGPGGLLQGSAVSPSYPANQNSTYSSWSTNGTSYACQKKSQSTILGGFTNFLFPLCSSSTQTAIPTQDISSLCSSSNPSFTVDNGTSKTIAAGKYGTVTLNGGKLTLSAPGTYSFYGLSLNAGSTVDFLGTASGIYYINICSNWNPSSNFNVTFSDTALDAMSVDYTKIRWYYGGTDPVTVNSGTTGFAGVITAPNAAVTVHPGKAINGMVHANSVYMDQGALTPVSGPDPCGGSSCTATTSTLFDQTYTGTCPHGSMPSWTYLTWDTTIGAQNPDASISFEVVRGDSVGAVNAATDADFTVVGPVAKYNAATSLDTQDCPLAGGVSSCPATLSDPARAFYSVIRLRARAKYACLATPISIEGWRVFYTCKDAL